MSSSDKSSQWALRRVTTTAMHAQAAQSSPEERALVQQSIVLRHLDLAESLARRYSGSVNDTDDLRQVAYVGLIKASRRFEPEKGDDFVSFAVPTISGEIKRYLRDCGWVIRPPRQIQELRARVNAVTPRLTQRLGRTPRLREIAASLGESVQAVDEAVESHNSLRPASLDVTVSIDGTATLADTLGHMDDRLDRVELLASVAPAIRRLTDRERHILFLRYFEEQTQQAIASELGVTQMHVSRLLAKILTQLNHDVADAAATPAQAPVPAAAPAPAAVAVSTTIAESARVAAAAA